MGHDKDKIRTQGLRSQLGTLVNAGRQGHWRDIFNGTYLYGQCLRPCRNTQLKQFTPRVNISGAIIFISILCLDSSS